MRCPHEDSVCVCVCGGNWRPHIIHWGKQDLYCVENSMRLLFCNADTWHTTQLRYVVQTPTPHSELGAGVVTWKALADKSVKYRQRSRWRRKSFSPHYHGIERTNQTSHRWCKAGHDLENTISLFSLQIGKEICGEKWIRKIYIFGESPSPRAVLGSHVGWKLHTLTHFICEWDHEKM